MEKNKEQNMKKHNVNYLKTCNIEHGNMLNSIQISKVHKYIYIFNKNVVTCYDSNLIVQHIFTFASNEKLLSFHVCDDKIIFYVSSENVNNKKYLYVVDEKSRQIIITLCADYFGQIKSIYLTHKKLYVYHFIYGYSSLEGISFDGELTFNASNIDFAYKNNNGDILYFRNNKIYDVYRGEFSKDHEIYHDREILNVQKIYDTYTKKYVKVYDVGNMYLIKKFNQLQFLDKNFEKIDVVGMLGHKASEILNAFELENNLYIVLTDSFIECYSL